MLTASPLLIRPRAKVWVPGRVLPNFRSSTTHGLVGWWKFNSQLVQATKVRDMSGNGNTGTLVNTPGLIGNMANRWGQSLNLNGSNQYVDISATSWSPGTGDFSVSFWTKTAAGGTQVGFSTTPTGGNNYWLGLTTGGQTNFSINGTNATGVAINDGNSHLLTGVRISTSFRLYIDGVSAAFTSIPAQTITTNPETIGRDGLSQPYYWSGTIDDVRLYNRALSPSEVYSLFRNPLGDFIFERDQVWSDLSNQNAAAFLAAWATNNNQIINGVTA